MALFSFLVANGAATINDAAGSGLGFYGPGGFADAVPIGSYNSHTYITNGAGTIQGAEAYNVMKNATGSGILGQSGSGLPLTSFPNYQATLNQRFTHGSAVRLTNLKFWSYDRSNPALPPSGVTVYAAEVVHPNVAQNNTGSGSSAWQNINGSGNALSLTSSPGTSGFRPNGAGTTDTQHDSYILISVTPTETGSLSQLGFMCSGDYL